jgi:hypothetical protein
VTSKTFDFKNIFVKFHVNFSGLYNNKDVAMRKLSTSNSAKIIINICNGTPSRWFTGAFNVS